MGVAVWRVDVTDASGKVVAEMWEAISYSGVAGVGGAVDVDTRA